jgi:gamma-glutamyltranspeptidase/glutathione hydrolase
MTEEQPIVWPWLNRFEAMPDLAGYRPVIGEQGLVASPHALASGIGLDILKAGGNAVDAAVAISAALMVTSPMQCGPGGDAFWLIAGGTVDGVQALDASGRASAKADAGALIARGLGAVPPRSAYAVTVPGAVSGWIAAHERFGSLPLETLLAGAVDLADRGVFASRHIRASFRIAETLLKETGAFGLWAPEGGRVALHQRIRQPGLAEALRGIAANGGDDFYRGRLARAMAAAVAAAGGWLDAEDLANHRAEWVQPVVAPFRDLVLHTTPPSSQGFSLLAALAFVEAASPRPLDVFAAEGAHLLVEAVAAALTDRDRHNDDRGRLGIDIHRLWDAPRVAEFLRDFDPARHRAPDVDGIQRITKGDTAHLAVVDRNGMAVSLIQSLYFDFGTGIPVPEGGFTLQNRGAGFHLTPDRPGFLAPGLRPPTTLMPTIATKGGRPHLVLGCMGGEGQMQTQLQLILDVTDGGLDVQQAVSRPRWYLDRSDPAAPKLMMERGPTPDLCEALGARGHQVVPLGHLEELMGHAQFIRLEEGSVLSGAADPRSDGQALAF